MSPYNISIFASRRLCIDGLYHVIITLMSLLYTRHNVLRLTFQVHDQFRGVYHILLTSRNRSFLYSFPFVAKTNRRLIFISIFRDLLKGGKRVRSGETPYLIIGSERLLDVSIILFHISIDKYRYGHLAYRYIHI